MQIGGSVAQFVIILRKSGISVFAYQNQSFPPVVTEHHSIQFPGIGADAAETIIEWGQTDSIVLAINAKWGCP